MTLEEVLPALKNNQSVKRKDMNGIIRIVKCPDNIDRLRILRYGQSIPYKFNEKDLFSNNWTII